jgi:hypothetical protein
MRSSLLIAAILALGAPHLAVAKGTPKAAKAKAPAAPKKKAPPPLTADHKKALAELYGGFKFGMTKEEVVGILKKQIDDKFDAKIKAAEGDIALQDRIRKDKKAEVSDLDKDYVEFNGTKTTGWDVSIVENEFAHNTGESLMTRWENESGKNNRRFFFFKDGKLWKMFLQLDVSVLPEDKRNFATLEQYMAAKYGPGDSDFDTGTITWRAGEFEARAVDHLKDYDAIGLAIEDPKVRTAVLAEREAHAPAKKETPAVIRAVLDTDDKDHPDIKANGGAVDAVIHAQGGKK